MSGRFPSAPKIDWFLLLLAALGVAALALVLAREATYGVALTWDSATHISAIRSLLDGNGFGAFNGVVYQPILGPLFPLASALVGLFGVEAIQAAAYVNAAAFGLTVFITAWWLKTRVQSRLLVVWAACACALTTGLAALAARVMGDILFTACVAASLFALDRFTATGKRSALVVAATCAAAACLTRPIGVTLVASGLLALLLRRGVEDSGEREGLASGIKANTRDAAIWLAVIGLPLLLWAARGVAVTIAGEGVFMMHWGAGFSLPTSLHTATTELVRWVYGDVGLGFLSALFERGVGVSLMRDSTAATLAVKAMLAVIPATALALSVAWRRPGTLAKNRDTLVVCFAFLSTYVAFLAVALPAVDLNIAGRYLRPLLPPVLVVVTVALAEIASGHASPSPAKQRSFNAIRTAVLLGAFLWLLPQVYANYNDVEKWNTIGFGYGRKQAIESETLRYLRNSPPADRIISNDEPGFYFWMNSTENVDGMTKQLERMKSLVASAHAAGERVVIPVFHVSFWKRDYDYDLEDLAELPGLRIAAFLEDGVVLESSADNLPTNKSTATSDDFGERALRALVEDGQRVAQAQLEQLDLYYNPRHRRLVYVREDCASGDWEYVGRQVFLHVYPVDASALPQHQQKEGFEELDFRFDIYGGTFGNRCIASRTLPAYDIATVKTGQDALLGREENWTAEISFQARRP